MANMASTDTDAEQVYCNRPQYGLSYTPVANKVFELHTQCQDCCANGKSAKVQKAQVLTALWHFMHCGTGSPTCNEASCLVSNGFVVRTYISSVPTHDRFTLIYQTQFTAAAYANGQLRRYLRSTNRLVSTLQRCIGGKALCSKTRQCCYGIETE